MRDAVQFSLQYMVKNAHQDKKALVVVTDGEDLASSTSLGDIVRHAQNDGVLIYTIGLLSGSGARRAKGPLRRLADETGGQSFFPATSSDTGSAAHEIARELRDQYTIAYTPSESAIDGSFRRINVKIRKGLPYTARTRAGYFATTR